ncbi:hypothetical protein CP557_01350 [Natrinema ejinorense]|uniref:DUF6884 domain-containing protein n=2 Tax=Natrinema ejinorense TaxID=373386 RepID=A0A2A5QR19_9EURY|nr:hypothetical protein CP557_01350 [Natrinema ejinorense]
MNLDRDSETNQAIQTFAIVSCGSKKADKETAAEDLYTSAHFQFKRRWAELYCDNWLILSAEHGLVGPGWCLEPYDTSVRDLDEDELQEWRADVEQALWYRSNSYEGNSCGNDVAWKDFPEDFSPNFELMMLTGQAYLEPFGDFFEETFPAPVYYPLEGKRIGEQNQWLKTWIEAHPSLEDITEETAVAIDFNHQVLEEDSGADIYYARHESGRIMVVSKDRTGNWSAEVLNDTPEEGVLNSPATAMRDNRCWTIPASEIPDVDAIEWEAEPTLADFAEGSA